MAKRAITNEGILCSVCGAIVQPETKLCYQCDSPLEGEFKAVICTACGSVAPAENQSCPFCGVEISERTGTHVKPVPRDVDSDIISVVEEVTAKTGVSGSSDDARASLTDWLKKMNSMVLMLDNAIAKKSWIELTSLKNAFSDMIEDAMSIVVGAKDLSNGSNPSSAISEEIRQKEQYIAQKMEELKREIEAREREGLKLKEKEKELLVKEQVIDDKSEAIAARLEEVQRLRAELEKKEKQIATKEEEIAECERKLEAKIINQAESPGAKVIPVPPGEASAQTKTLTEGIDRAKVLTNQLIGYFKKRAADDSGKIVVALEKITSQLEGLVVPAVQASIPAPVPAPPKEPEAVKEELKRVLKALDTLLEKLPENVISQFANTEEFKLYERVLDRYGV
jgi:hypothetical protein